MDVLWTRLSCLSHVRLHERRQEQDCEEKAGNKTLTSQKEAGKGRRASEVPGSATARHLELLSK